MKPADAGFRAGWSGVEELGDCFELILHSLQPADIAACRLVACAWRRHSDLLLQQLQPAPGAHPAAVAAAWPHLARLRLAAGAHAALPPLEALPALRCLRSMALQGPPGVLGALDCRGLAPLAAMPRLEALEFRGLLLHHASALQRLTQLAGLALQGCALGEWAGTLPALLQPLGRLTSLRFQAPRLPGVGEPGLGGLACLTSLVCLELGCEEAASDAVCAEAARLPRLAGLAITRCASYGDAAPSVGDAGLRVLAGLAAQLTSLSLVGHRAVTDEGVAALAACRQLHHLELRLGDPAPPSRLALPLLSDEGLCALASLTRLRSLHLGGACALPERACTALAARLPALTSLQLSDVRSLSDAAVFALAPLAPRLRQLGLCCCEGVTDIALAGMLKQASRLTRLELAGCHRNVTGLGLQVAGLRRLRHLNLAGCDAITDADIQALLPAAASLEHLNLSDCRVSDRACSLLAAHAPSLQWLSLEHCPRVSKQGLLCLAAGLPQLRELHLVGAGVPAEAAAQLRTTPRGRRLHVATLKPCWWVPADLAERLGGAGTAAVAAA